MLFRSIKSYRSSFSSTCLNFFLNFKLAAFIGTLQCMYQILSSAIYYFFVITHLSFWFQDQTKCVYMWRGGGSIWISTKADSCWPLYYKGHISDQLFPYEGMDRFISVAHPEFGRGLSVWQVNPLSTTRLST